MGDATSVRLEQIGQIALTVTDLERAKRFYGEALGLKHLFDAGRMVFFQCGEVRLLVGLAEGALAPGGGTILYFRVAEIGRAHAALVAKGVEFVQGPQMVAKMPDHELWLAEFADPDGNRLALMSEVRG